MLLSTSTVQVIIVDVKINTYILSLSSQKGTPATFKDIICIMMSAMTFVSYQG